MHLIYFQINVHCTYTLTSVAVDHIWMRSQVTAPVSRTSSTSQCVRAMHINLELTSLKIFVGRDQLMSARTTLLFPQRGRDDAV